MLWENVHGYGKLDLCIVLCVDCVLQELAGIPLYFLALST